MKLKNLKTWKRSGTKLANTFLAIVLLGAVLSCGNRKTNQSKKNIKSDSISVENKLILKQNSILRDIQKLRPFDPSKPMFVDGKEYFNVSIDYDKSQFERIEIDVGSKKIELKKDIFIKEKQVEKTDYTILYIGLIFIICLFVFLYFYLPTLKFNYLNRKKP
jgi:hypothetical protein